MPASSTAPTSVPVLPPYSRSHGGRGAGSSGRPGRRNPPESRSASGASDRRRRVSAGAQRSVGGPPVAFIQTARRKLSQERAFRINQLDQLQAAREDLATDAARTEIHIALRSGAQAVLAEIEAALRRIEQGSYGRCDRCGDAISLDRLDVLPMAAVCRSCQRGQELHMAESTDLGTLTTGAAGCADACPPARSALIDGAWRARDQRTERAGRARASRVASHPGRPRAG